MFKIAKITGHSMQPTLQEGDLLFVVNLWKVTKYKKRQIVIFESGLPKTPYLIKRISNIWYEINRCGNSKEFVWLQGDNLEHSYDSTKFGKVEVTKICGVAIFGLRFKLRNLQIKLFRP